MKYKLVLALFATFVSTNAFAELNLLGVYQLIKCEGSSAKFAGEIAWMKITTPVKNPEQWKSQIVLETYANNYSGSGPTSSTYISDIDAGEVNGRVISFSDYMKTIATVEGKTLHYKTKYYHSIPDVHTEGVAGEEEWLTLKHGELKYEERSPFGNYHSICYYKKMK